MTDIYIEIIERLKREIEQVREGGMCALAIAEEDHRATKIALCKAEAERDAAIAALREAGEALEILKPRCAYVVTGDHGFDGYVTAEWVEEKKAATLTRINELTKDTP